MNVNALARVTIAGTLLLGLSPLVPARAAPEIQFDKDAISGLATGGIDADFVFNIRNSGDQNLVISKVTPSCGCTTAELRNKVVAPGKQVQLKGTYQVDDARPTFVVYILVQSNAENAPLKRLVIAGRNYPEDVEMSATFLDFHVIEGRRAPPKFFSLKTKERVSLEKTDLVLKSLDGGPVPQPGMFSVKDVKSSAHELSLLVVAEEPKKIGRYAATLRLDTLIDRKPQRLEIPIALENAQAFLLAPSQVKIPSRAHATDYSARALIKHHANEPFVVRAVESPSVAIETQIKQSSPSAYFIYLTVTTPSVLPDSTMPVRIEVEQNGLTRVLELPLVFSTEP
jgi:hypothetical protein